MAGRETAAMPRGRRGLSPAARAAAATRAARTTALIAPLLARRSAGAGMTRVGWLPLRSAVPPARAEWWTSASSLSATLLQRYVLTPTPPGSDARAVRGHRALYSLLRRLGPPHVDPGGVGAWAEDGWAAQEVMTAEDWGRDDGQELPSSPLGFLPPSPAPGATSRTFALEMLSRHVAGPLMPGSMEAGPDAPPPHDPVAMAFALVPAGRWLGLAAVAAGAALPMSRREGTQDWRDWSAAPGLLPGAPPGAQPRQEAASAAMALLGPAEDEGGDAGTGAAGAAARPMTGGGWEPARGPAPGAPTRPPGAGSAPTYLRRAAGTAAIPSLLAAAARATMAGAAPALIGAQTRQDILRRATARQGWQPAYEAGGPIMLAVRGGLPPLPDDPDEVAGPAAPDAEPVTPAYTALPELLRLAANIRRKGEPGNAVPDLRRRAQALSLAAGSSGRPLDPVTRVAMEGALGADLGGVRLHVGDAAAGASSALGARAFALGQDIYFARGAFEPSTPAGLALLGHELVHTTQRQTIPQRSPLGGTADENHDEPPELERQAVETEATLLRTFSALQRLAEATPSPSLAGEPAGGAVPSRSSMAIFAPSSTASGPPMTQRSAAPPPGSTGWAAGTPQEGGLGGAPAGAAPLTALQRWTAGITGPAGTGGAAPFTLVARFPEGSPPPGAAADRSPGAVGAAPLSALQRWAAGSAGSAVPGRGGGPAPLYRVPSSPPAYTIAGPGSEDGPAPNGVGGGYEAIAGAGAGAAALGGALSRQYATEEAPGRGAPGAGAHLPGQFLAAGAGVARSAAAHLLSPGVPPSLTVARTDASLRREAVLPPLPGDAASPAWPEAGAGILGPAEPPAGGGAGMAEPGGASLARAIVARANATHSWAAPHGAAGGAGMAGAPAWLAAGTRSLGGPPIGAPASLVARSADDAAPHGSGAGEAGGEEAGEETPSSALRRMTGTTHLSLELAAGAATMEGIAPSLGGGLARLADRAAPGEGASGATGASGGGGHRQDAGFTVSPMTLARSTAALTGEQRGAAPSLSTAAAGRSESVLNGSAAPGMATAAGPALARAVVVGEAGADSAAAPAQDGASAAEPTSAGGAPAGAGHEGVALEDLVEQVLSRVKRELVLEHERAGGFLPDLSL